MIQFSDLRINNLINYQGEDITLTEELFGKLLYENDPEAIEPVKLTKEWARDLGFEVIDMGDFWEFEKGDFKMIQLKAPILNRMMPISYLLFGEKKSKHVKLPFVHKLQNLYFEIEGAELIPLKG
ncbi:MAG: hypothetical protein V4511_03015 [Bacteroidota bacterium]